MTKTKLNIFIENAYEEFGIDEVLIYKDVIKMSGYIFSEADIMSKSCLTGCKYNTISFDIVFVNNEEIRRINRDYRNKDRVTDVITFALFADAAANERFIIDGDINLGEIIISLDKVKEQAEENNKTFKDELYFIISHGILHLSGFDHMTDEDYNFMVKYQNLAKGRVIT